MTTHSRALLLFALAGVAGACAPATISEQITVRPLREQSATRLLVDKDDCERAAPALRTQRSATDRILRGTQIQEFDELIVRAQGYAACMIARGYEAEVPIAFVVRPRYYDDVTRRLHVVYRIGADEPVSEVDVVEGIRSCSAATVAALAPVADNILGERDPGPGIVWPLVLPFAMAARAKVDRVVDQTFPLCMARRGLAVLR